MLPKPGDFVYVVRDIDPYDDSEPHTWEVLAVKVVRSSKGQVVVAGVRAGARTTYRPAERIWAIYSPSPLEALKRFVAWQKQQLDSLERKKRETLRSIEWAESQEGMTP